MAWRRVPAWHPRTGSEPSRSMACVCWAQMMVTPLDRIVQAPSVPPGSRAWPASGNGRRLTRMVSRSPEGGAVGRHGDRPAAQLAMGRAHQAQGHGGERGDRLGGQGLAASRKTSSGSRPGQPPAHTARVRPRPAGRLGQAERLEQLTSPRLGAPPRMTEQAGDHDEVLRAGRGPRRPRRTGRSGSPGRGPRRPGWRHRAPAPGRAGVRRSGVASIRIVVVVATAYAFSMRGWFRPVMAS